MRFTIYYFSSNFDKELLDSLVEAFDNLNTISAVDYSDDVIELRTENSILLRIIVKKIGGMFIFNPYTQKTTYTPDDRPSTIVNILKLKIELEQKRIDTWVFAYVFICVSFIYPEYIYCSEKKWLRPKFSSSNTLS